MKGTGVTLAALGLLGAACQLALDVDDYEFAENTGGSGGSEAAGTGGGAPSGGTGGDGAPSGGGASGSPEALDRPRAAYDVYSFPRAATYEVAAARGVLANDTGSDLRVAELDEQPTERGGRVLLTVDGGFVYAPPHAQFWGDDRFAYAIENADGQSNGRVRLSVQPGELRMADVASGTGHGWVINASNIEAPVGNAVAAAGDVNGDGLADVIVGAPFEDAEARGGAIVIFGKRTAAGQANPPPLSLTDFPAGSGFRIVGAVAGGRAGISVSGAGDVNGDGYADVIVGVPGPEPAVDAGSAYVVFGKAATNAVSLADLALDGGTQGFRLDGGNVGDYAGTTVAGAGDVNGDGLADVIVGAPLASGGVGEGHVVYGKTSGASLVLGALSASEGFTITGTLSEANDLSVAGAGDMNGDGLTEVAAATRSGVFVVFGSATGAAVDLGALTPAQGFAVRGSDEDALEFARAAGAGDVNGDGYDDLILSAPLRRALAVVYGGQNRADVALDGLSAADGFMIEVGALYDQNSIGFSLAGGGDLNGDGLMDLMIGAWNEGSGSFPATAYWVFGSTETQTLSLVGLERGLTLTGVDLENSSVSSAGDVNGDGLGDWIIGTGRSNTLNDAFVLYGWDATEALQQRDRGLSRAPDGEPLIFDGEPLIGVTGSLQPDVLTVSGSGVTLDLSAPAPRLSSIEELDLTGSGDNTLLLDDRTVRSAPQTRAGLPAPLVKTFVVNGDAGDRVLFDLSDYSQIATNAGRVVYRKNGAFYGLEVSLAEMIVAPEP